MISFLLFVGSQSLSFGHSCVRYVLPRDCGGPEVLVDLRAVRDVPQGGLDRQHSERLITWFHDPADYFFRGEKRPRVFSRSYCSVRVGPVDKDKVLAMHYYFKSVDCAHAGNSGEPDSIVGYDFLGIVKAVYYFWRPDLRSQRRANCAQYISEGLFLAGLIARPQLFPKAIWVTMFEQALLVPRSAHKRKNMFITYYRQKPPGGAASCCKRTRMLINSVVTPISFYRNCYYRKLERFADAVVTLGEDSVARCHSPDSPARPNCWTRQLFSAGNWVFPVLCFLWLGFGWPDDNYVRNKSLLAGLGARAFLAALLMSAYSLMH